MAYQIFCLLFVRTTGTDLQHDLQHGLQHGLRNLKNHRLFELSVQSIIGAQDIRQGTIFCDFLSIADVYRSEDNRARASFQSVYRSSALVFGLVTTNVATESRCRSSVPPFSIRLRVLGSNPCAQVRRHSPRRASTRTTLTSGESPLPRQYVQSCLLVISAMTADT